MRVYCNAQAVANVWVRCGGVSYREGRGGADGTRAGPLMITRYSKPHLFLKVPTVWLDMRSGFPRKDVQTFKSGKCNDPRLIL